MPKGKLTDEARTFAVQALACFDTPNDVADAIRKEFGIEITAQSVEAYDPTKVAGRNLGKRWTAIFEQTRKDFLENTALIAISHRAVRLRALQRMAEKAERSKASVASPRLLASRGASAAFSALPCTAGGGRRPLVMP